MPRHPVWNLRIDPSLLDDVRELTPRKVSGAKTLSERVRALIERGLTCVGWGCPAAVELDRLRAAGPRSVDQGAAAVGGEVVVDGSLVYPAREVVVPVGEGSQAIGDASWDPA